VDLENKSQQLMIQFHTVDEQLRMAQEEIIATRKDRNKLIGDLNSMAARLEANEQLLSE
jgi:hypothetical protein